MGVHRILLMLLVLGVIAACGSDESPERGADESLDDTTAAPAHPTLIFDGTTCAYRGPAQVVVGGLTPVVLENTSDIDIDAGLFWVRSQNALDAAYERLSPGTGSDILLAPPPGSIQEAWLQASPGERNEESLLLEPGFYLMDCARIPAGGSVPDFVWRGGSFEGIEG